MIYSVGAFPEPSNPPYSVRTLHIRGNLTGQKLTTGENQTARGRRCAAIFPFPRGRSPERRPASRGERCPPRQRERERDKKQRAEIENIALLVHRFLFASTFYVRMWVFPRMGPKGNRGTSLLKIERLFPRRSTGLSGGTLLLFTWCVNMNVGVPPEGRKDPWGNADVPNSVQGARRHQEASLEASGGIWRHLEASGGIWRRLEASGGI